MVYWKVLWKVRERACNNSPQSTESCRAVYFSNSMYFFKIKFNFIVIYNLKLESVNLVANLSMHWQNNNKININSCCSTGEPLQMK